MIPSDERILEILRHPEIYPLISDDFSPPREEFIPSPAAYLEPVEGFLVRLEPLYTTVWSAHICALPEARGRGVEAVERAAEWLRVNTVCERVLAMFPDANEAVGKLVKKSGFEFVGVIPDSFRRGGRLLSLHLYSLRIR